MSAKGLGALMTIGTDNTKISGLLHADDQFWLASSKRELTKMTPVAETWQNQSGAKYHVGKEKTVLLQFEATATMMMRPEDETKVILNGSECHQAESKKYLGIIVDTKLRYDEDFSIVLKKMKSAGMQLASLTAANEIPWFFFIEQLWAKVLTKAYYHCLHIASNHQWEDKPSMA